MTAGVVSEADSEAGGRGPGVWARMRLRASNTPPTRNRYVDFLRAASITVVVLGHWLMAAPTLETGVGFTLSDILRVAPWTQWLTWIFQVMPIFFAVGGYANAASWESARARGDGYDVWVSRRLQRLVRPAVPFLFLWCALGLSARWLGVGREVVQTGSRAAFVPTWFLAVYVLVVVLAPAMHRLWRRFGLTSFWALVVAATAVDAAARAFDLEAVRSLNYVFVWLAIHQLGYAWHAGALSESVRSLSFALGGFAALIVLEGLAYYPVSMVTVPGNTPANSTPPTVALLALGVTHVSLAAAVQGRVRPFVERQGVWVGTVLVNAVIMTLYLWHATVMVLLVGAAELLGGVGLRSVPNTAQWWLFRPPWVVVLLVGLVGFVAVFGRVEARGVPAERRPPAWRSVTGAIALCVGLVALTTGGIGGDDALGLWIWPVALSVGGAFLVTTGRRGAVPSKASASRTGAR